MEDRKGENKHVIGDHLGQDESNTPQSVLPLSARKLFAHYLEAQRNPVLLRRSRGLGHCHDPTLCQAHSWVEEPISGEENPVECLECLAKHKM